MVRNEFNKGITLIALAITIVVLLILAGIAINSIMGNDSAMEKAKEARIQTELAEIDENIKFAVMGINTKYHTQQGSNHKSYYYETEDRFITEGKFDTNSATINDYDYDGENKKVKLKVVKNNGTGEEFEFEIEIDSNKVTCISHQNLGNTGKKNNENKIAYVLNDGQFEASANVVYEYTKGTIINFLTPIKENNVFEGWYTTADFSGKKVSSTTPETDGDITLYAKWMKETDIGYFTYSEDKHTIIGFSDSGANAFKNGTIKELVFPKQNDGVILSSIGGNAFSTSNSKISENGIVLEKIVIPDSVTALNQETFKNCTSLKDLTIPITISAVYTANPSYSSAFNGCTGITKVKLTKGQTGQGFNYTNGGLNDTYTQTPWYISRVNEMTVEIEEGVTSIGNYTFCGCSKIQNISIPNTVTSIGAFAFNGCSSMAGELNTIENVTSIGNSAFNGCSSITGTLNIPSGLTTIGSNVFAGTNITKLVIHDNVTSLNQETFKNCTSLKDLTIPITISAVYTANPSYSSAFNGCTGITKVKLTKGQAGQGFNYTNGGLNDTYTQTPWYISRVNEMTVEIEEGVTSIGNYTFCGCSKIQNISIPNTVTSIGASAFNGCSSMAGELNTIENVTSIGNSAFNGCSSITGTLNIPSGLTTIGSNVFAGTNITKLVIHDNVTSLNQETFKDCTQLKDITIPVSLNAIYTSNPNSRRAFSGCHISKVTFTKGNGNAFDYENSIFTTVYKDTPWYSSSEGSIIVVINSDVTTIGKYTLHDINKATIYYKGSEEDWAKVDSKKAYNSSLNNVQCNYSE